MITLADLAPFEAEIIENYKYLHQYPELSFEEQNTSRFVAQKLLEYGLSPHTGVAILGVTAEISGELPGKTVLLRADMDALPVSEDGWCDYASKVPCKMHACGHDAHVAMLLGAAKYFSQNRQKIHGSIRFVFQPGEENGENALAITTPYGYNGVGGAKFMIAEHAADNVDACFSIHVNPLEEVGRLYVSRRDAMAAGDGFAVTISGTGGHGSAPHKATDPISAAAEIINAYNLLVPREVSALETAVVNIGALSTPGSVWNIIPQKVIISGTIRTFSPEVREYIIRRLEELAGAFAAANRCESEFSLNSGFDAVINDERMSRAVFETAEKLLGRDNVTLSDRPFMSSEDFGAYFTKAPGALMWLGVCKKGGSSGNLHSPLFRLDTSALAIGSAVHCANALNFLDGCKK